MLSSYLLYYHEDRTHLGLAKDTPAGRATEIRSASGSKIQFNPFRESAGCTIAMRWQRRLKSKSSEDQTLFLETRTRHGSHFCEHLSLGETDHAFSWQEKAYEERDASLAWLKVAPESDALRSDPRFTDLLRRMKFPIHS